MLVETSTVQVGNISLGQKFFCFVFGGHKHFTVSWEISLTSVTAFASQLVVDSKATHKKKKTSSCSSCQDTTSISCANLVVSRETVTDMRKQAQGQCVFASLEKTWSYYLGSIRLQNIKSKLMQSAGQSPDLFCFKFFLSHCSMFLWHNSQVSFYQATSKIQASISSSSSWQSQEYKTRQISFHL